METIPTLLICACLAIASISTSPPWMDQSLPAPKRASLLVDAMYPNEKITMLHGVPGDYVGVVLGNNRLGIPPLNLQDGPQGVGDGAENVTCWPGVLTAVSSFDEQLIYKYANSIAVEQLNKGVTVLLGPMVNIARIPYQGRNFESMGEDPVLTATMAGAYVRGAQDQGIIANVKHFVNNNQEFNRTTTSANIDLRAQHEIYYPGFKSAVENGVLSVMCGYNRVNDTWDCENSATLNGVLKGTFNFQGFVVSDWLATHSTVKAANAGLDMEMPGSTYFSSALSEAVASGQVSQHTIDDKVTRILTAMFAVGLFDRFPYGHLWENVRTQNHTLLARDIAANGAILLQNNNNLLPLSLKESYTIAIIGDLAKNPNYAGVGSGNVNPPYVVSIFDGISQLLLNSHSKVNLVYASSNITEAKTVAQNADVVIVVVGCVSSEGVDRSSLSLGNKQDQLVQAVASANPRTVVVGSVAGAITTPWRNQVSSILLSFMPGQEVGNAMAELLFGLRNPSGRLPITFPDSEAQYGFTTAQYPGIDNEAEYSEGLLVGYRWFDAKHLEPAFPFGHGLSYTSFAYKLLDNQMIAQAHSALSFTVEVSNVGERQGCDVVQVYLGFPEQAGEPPKVLKSFRKVCIDAGESKTVEFCLSDADFSIFQVNVNQFVPFAGKYEVYVSSSSRRVETQFSHVYSPFMIK